MTCPTYWLSPRECQFVFLFGHCPTRLTLLSTLARNIQAINRSPNEGVTYFGLRLIKNISDPGESPGQRVSFTPPYAQEEVLGRWQNMLLSLERADERHRPSVPHLNQIAVSWLHREPLGQCVEYMPPQSIAVRSQ